MADVKEEVKKVEAEVEQDVKEAEETVGDFINKHAISSEVEGALHDMNYQQLADHLGFEVREIVDICKELGHKLPQGA